ncbi:hypothetical protein O7635_36585 [Asanoa sp. WMMD1127]|uniref:hypothetical protein n=1 Tax=Asanoa sp. WMMD1127 TaxID=3016107 RepID=UPI002416C8BA|nr:hypothetical protein [Asanoa sp. WMMD1127]MDG4827393.1 hypothetical protein [Asanoa sp. WMMD1127]
MQDLEGDMVRAVAALRGAVEFLHRYDRLHASLRAESGGGPSPLTSATEDGLAAAHRVLDGLRSPDGRPRRAAPFIPAQRTPPDRHGDPGE